jgi:hypothetical protein
VAVGTGDGERLRSDRRQRSVAFLIDLPLGAAVLHRAVKTLDESSNPEAGAPLDLVGIGLVIAAFGSSRSGSFHVFVGEAAFALVTALLALPVDTRPRT